MYFAARMLVLDRRLYDTNGIDVKFEITNLDLGFFEIFELQVLAEPLTEALLPASRIEGWHPTGHLSRATGNAQRPSPGRWPRLVLLKLPI